MTLSLAVLGCGAIARTHAKTLAGFRGRVRLGFASRDAARADDYRRALRGFAAWGGYDAAFADPAVDAVLITTPPVNHLELTLAALDAGKHVIVEKPPFLSVAELGRVAERAEEAGRRVLVAENYAYKPLTLLLERLLAAGEIGTLRLVRLSALKHQLTPDWRGAEAIAGGGALFEGGVHWVNLLGWLGDDIVEVAGYGPPVTGGLERTLVVVVRYRSGAIGTLHHSWETPARLKGVSLSQITGSSGTILFESNGIFVALNGKRRRIFLPGFRDIRGFRAMWADFLNALTTGAAARMTLARARSDLAVIEAAYQTARKG
jgi:predicted dehydrogenase